MKVYPLALMLCMPLALDATCGSVACNPSDDNACAVSCMTVTVENATALYEGDVPVIGGTAPTQNIDFQTIDPAQGAVKDFSFTVGTFDPGSPVSVSAEDSAGSAHFGFALKNAATQQMIGFDMQYQDCSDPDGLYLHAVPYNTPFPLSASQASMVAVSDYPNGTAPCHPYVSGTQVGHGAGQLIFTIPPATPGGEPAGGDYTDTVTFTVNAD